MPVTMPVLPIKLNLLPASATAVDSNQSCSLIVHASYVCTLDADEVSSRILHITTHNGYRGVGRGETYQVWRVPLLLKRRAV
jgi:hypothetical protein